MKTIKKASLGILVILIAMTIVSCYYDEVIPVEKPVGDVGVVTFAADIIPIFNSSCNTTGCHSAGGVVPDLTSTNAYNALTTGGYINVPDPENSTLYLWMRGELGLVMPPSGSDATYNAKVLAWIEQGALNN